MYKGLLKAFGESDGKISTLLEIKETGISLERFEEIATDIIAFIRKQNHPNLFLHNNGLLFVYGTEKPATWMNAVEDGRPITPRTGYVVEINALWYNALKFTSQGEIALVVNYD